METTGIINRATEAKEKTEEAQKQEENTLNSYEDTINEYMGIDWDTVLANAEKHPNQETSTAIGVGTDGRPVNMDLWEYTKLDDGTYALNSEETLAESDTRTAGYTGNIIDGKIEGTIPQYIKDESDNNFIEVTNLESLFYYYTNLIEAPVIPTTVTNMSRTFAQCSSLTKAPVIPNGVTNMYGTFAQCSSLMEPPEIPITVTSMSKTFLDCTLLKEAPIIPSSVIDLSATFQNCSQLANPPEIPMGVVNMESTFRLCSSLVTVPTIPNTVKNLAFTFDQCYSLENVTLTIFNVVENMEYMFSSCHKLSGKITIYANISNIENEQYIFSNANLKDYTTEELEVLCPGEVYNKYYDESKANKLNVDIFGENSNNIKLTKLQE